MTGGGHLPQFLVDRYTSDTNDRLGSLQRQMSPFQDASAVLNVDSTPDSNSNIARWLATF